MSEDLSTIIEFSEDISAAEAPDPLPGGEYPATIKGVEMKTSGAGNVYPAISLHISPEDFPADYPAENNPDGLTLIYRRVSILDTPQSRWQMRKFCEAIGAPTAKQIDVNEWIGLDCTVVTETEEYEGVVRENIRSIEEAA